VRPLAIVFNSGLLPSGVLLLRGHSADLWLMLPLGIVHVCAIWIVARRLDKSLDQAVIDTLHKAGFLHTLLGLGAAIVVLGTAPGTGASVAQASLVAPLGTAVIPHVLGVWLGHVIELRHSFVDSSPEGIEKHIAESGEAAWRFLNDAERHARKLSQSLESTATQCADSASRVKTALGDLGDTARRSTQAARDFEAAVKDVSTATDHLVTVHRQLVDLLNSALLKRSGGKL
jgi:hypothetical protein